MAEDLKRSEILRRRKDLTRVLRFGHRIPPKAGTRQERLPLVLCYCRQVNPSTPETPTRRIAFLLSYDLLSSVRRNRLKRLLREIYRRNKKVFPEHYDYALLVGDPCYMLDHQKLKAETLRLASMVS
ncbi:MAG: ribonuclease P protein component [candidate division WOR-3 bacterium]